MAQTEKQRKRNAVGLCDPNSEFFDGPCKDNRAEMMDACKVTKGENDKFIDRREDRNRRIEKRNRDPKTRNKREKIWVRNKNWKDDHCKSALFQVNRDSLQSSMDNIKDGSEQLQEYIEEVLKDLPREVAEKVAKKKAVAMGARGACAALVFPPAIAACVAAVTAADLIDSAIDAAELAEELQHLKERMDDLDKLRKDAERAQKVFNQDGSINDDELKKFQDEKVQEMTEAVGKNPCLKARRCFLTPYSNTGKQGTYRPASPPQDQRRTMMDKFGSEKHSLADPRGCCPGMTGHHLVLNAWMDNEAGGSNCPNYNAGDAPVVCVVGADHKTGEHGRIHTETDRLLREHMQENACEFTLDDSIDIATEALKETVGPGCDPKCIRAQLENHYIGGGADGIGCKRDTSMTPYHVGDRRNIKGICGGMA